MHIYIIVKSYIYFQPFSYIFQDNHTLIYLLSDHYDLIFKEFLKYQFESKVLELYDNRIMVDTYDSLFY